MMSDRRHKYICCPSMNGQIFCSFLIPMIIMVIAFALAGIAPFGNRNLMAMDGYAQYFPMLREYVRADSQWSFAGALGFNQLTQSAYYTNSPLWLLLFLVPEKFIIEGIHFIVILRFGLAGLSFAYFLLHNYKYRSNFVFVFASAYALSAYTLAFINQFMWMDLVILLPFLAGSLQSLWEEGRFLSYVLFLSIALYSNFYLAYILCIFAVLWSLYLIFRQKSPAAKRWHYLSKFMLASLVSAGLVAFVLLPTFLSLQKTLAANVSLPRKLKLYHPIWKYLLHFLPFQKISLAYEEANIYCGLTTLALVAFYFLYKRRTVSEKCFFLLFLIGSYLSFNLNFFDYLWHGFHYPSQLPARQSFLFIFVCLIYAYKAYNEGNFLVNYSPKGSHRRIIKFNLKTLVAVLLFCEILANSVFTVTVYTWKAHQDQYIKFEAEMCYLTENYAPQANDFYRMEFLQPSHNQGMRYGYNGLGYYSSLMSEQAYQFFKDIGMGVYAKNVSTDYVPDPLLNNLFAVRYLIQDKANPVNIDSLNLTLVEELDKLTLYENPNYYPIGFALQKVNFRKTKASQMREQLGQYINANQESHKLSFLDIEVYTPTRILGHLSLEQEGQLLTSIGSEDGWKIIVDGKEANTFTAFDYLLAAPLTAGEHVIELVYLTPGRVLGWEITSASALILLVWFWLGRGKGVKSKQEK